MSAVVTNPIAKHVLYAAGFAHPGHTEYLGELAGAHWPGSNRPVMLLWSEALAVVPVTIHVALKDVPRLLTAELLMDTARTVTPICGASSASLHRASPARASTPMLERMAAWAVRRSS